MLKYVKGSACFFLNHSFGKETNDSIGVWLSLLEKRGHSDRKRVLRRALRRGIPILASCLSKLILLKFSDLGKISNHCTAFPPVFSSVLFFSIFSFVLFSVAIF